MPDYPLIFAITFSGSDAEESRIDFYDVAQALVGFQRTIALTTHLVLNEEVIVQAPALKGAQIVTFPFEEGSWRAKAAVVGTVLTGAYFLGTAPHDTPIGNIVSSAYDYVISETLGFHVDYDKTLLQQYEEHYQEGSAPKLRQDQLDSLTEKCEVAVRNMHRPIVNSGTAINAKISAKIGTKITPMGPLLTADTFEYLDFTRRIDEPLDIVGRVSSYNSNTFKGRIFVPKEGRPIPFELAYETRSDRDVAIVTGSLSANAGRRNRGDIRCVAFASVSRTGRLKSYFIVEIKAADTNLAVRE